MAQSLLWGKVGFQNSWPLMSPPQKSLLECRLFTGNALHWIKIKIQCKEALIHFFKVDHIYWPRRREEVGMRDAYDIDVCE